MDQMGKTRNERERIRGSQKYFKEIVREFIYSDDPVFITNKQRDIRLSNNTKKHIENLRYNQIDWLRDVFDDKLDLVVQDWIRTRASYDAASSFPSSNLKNFLAWQKVGVVYLYIIDGSEAYIDVIPPSNAESFVYWAKLACRFIDCRHYPNVKHYFDITTSEVATGIDKEILLQDLKSAFGDINTDQTKHKMPNRVEYKEGNIISIKGNVD